MASDDYNDMKPHRLIVGTRVVLVGEKIWQNVTPYCAPFNGKYEHVSVVMRNGAVVSFAFVLLGHSTTCTYNAIHNSFIRS